MGVQGPIYMSEFISASPRFVIDQQEQGVTSLGAILFFSPTPVDVFVLQTYFTLTIACSSSPKPGHSNIPSCHGVYGEQGRWSWAGA
jgi:hypothetical protein